MKNDLTLSEIYICAPATFNLFLFDSWNSDCERIEHKKESFDQEMNYFA